MPTMIGHVTQERYDQIVSRGRELVELQTRSQFELRMLHPQPALVWGDSAYAGTLVEWARRFLRLTLKIVTKLPGRPGSRYWPGGGSSKGRSGG